MSLLGLQDVSLAFGGPALLSHADFSIERGERVCLLGRNGTGKSTLLKLLDGSLQPDAGTVVRLTGLSVSGSERMVRAFSLTSSPILPSPRVTARVRTPFS